MEKVIILYKDGARVIVGFGLRVVVKPARKILGIPCGAASAMVYGKNETGATYDCAIETAELPELYGARAVRLTAAQLDFLRGLETAINEFLKGETHG